MRAVILFNPLVPVEHHTKGLDYAEACVGFDFDGVPDDLATLAKCLRELADTLDAEPTCDPDFFRS